MHLQHSSQDKILTIEHLSHIIFQWKFFKKKIVFTNGCFDLLHAGHIHSLNAAAALGDKLIVGLNSDASVKRLKGENRPLQTEQNRALILASLSMVDAVVIFDEDTPLEIIKNIMPDVLAKGGDYTPETIVGAKEVIANGGKVEIIPLIPGLSTTNLEKMIINL
ncbi:MAG: D-glycero-beta-D-manno-heptose 1-phosphate adenylyltransferase [Bacteroidota bacterium]